MTPAPDASEPRLTIDLDAVAENYRTLRDLSHGAEAAPVLKADAYGTGAAEVGRKLWAEGARTFFVARASEGEALRAELGEARPADIYTLDGCPLGSADRLRAAGLIPVLNGLDQVETWAAAASPADPAPCALHIDTGMNRLGLRAEEAAALADGPGRLHRLDVRLVISHLACSNIIGHPMNAVQLAAFHAAAVPFPHARRSLSSSSGLFLGPDYTFDMVRLGISLYGGGPFDAPDARIRPVATLEAPLLQVRTVRPGETIGYGATFTVDRPLRVGVIALGYADGALRSLSPQGYGWLSGRRCGILGRISMDLIAMDVSEVEFAAPGQWVEMFGAQAPVDIAAANGGTTSYELLSRISPRVGRIYRGSI